MSTASNWIFWALLSAVFAALTTIFAKLGLAGVDSDYATLLRTIVIVLLLATFVVATGKWSDPTQLAPRTLAFLVLSALATGASWVCYFRALQMGDTSSVASIDKASLVLVAIFAVTFLGDRPTIRQWTGIALVAAGVLVLGFRR